MGISSRIRAAVIASAVACGTASASHAETCSITLTIYKAGWFIGGSGGGGTLYCRGRSYHLSTGGIDAGLVFGGSRTLLHGWARNIVHPTDVEGVYAAVSAGIAIGAGARAIALTNHKGVILELTGSQVGLMANFDLSGLAISMD